MKKNNIIKKNIYIGISVVVLIILSLSSMKIGSIDITLKELLVGIFTNNGEKLGIL